MSILNKRASGILLHISSLPSIYGIGDFGREAYKFIDFLKNAKQRYWQILPLNPTSLSKANSPYASFSAFAGNILFISPELLFEEGFLSRTDLDAMLSSFNNMSGKNSNSKPSGNSGNKIDYKKTTDYKNRIFDIAFKNFKSHPEKYKDAFDFFCTENSKKWLEDFSSFIAFKNYFKKRIGILSWQYWPENIKNKNYAEISKLKKELKHEISKEKFLQFIFFNQWQNLKRYANSKGIKIIGDIPIYVDYESSDTWSNPEIFKLDKNKAPAFIAGVPPDYFSKTGQLWNNPVYNWESLKQGDFAWWVERFAHNLKLFDIVRIDHFRGLVAYWEIPACEKTAQKGKWVKCYPEDFLVKLQEKLGNLPIIAENLGVITPEVDEIMNKFDLPGIKVLQFAFGSDFPNSKYLPGSYEKNSVVYTGTHDNNTLKGWFEKDIKALGRKNLSKYLGKEINKSNICRELIKIAMDSASNLSIIPMQDILELGWQARMNHPSTVRGNWKWQMPEKMLAESLEKKVGEITEKYHRI